MRNKPIFCTLVLTGLVALCGAGCTAKARISYHLHKADSYFTAGQYDQAEIEYLKVLASDKYRAYGTKRLGILCAEQGRTIAALQFLTMARGMDTNDVEVRLKLASITLQLGAPGDAHNEASFVVDRAPTNQEAIVILASSAIGTNANAQTRQRIQKLIQQGRDSAAAETALGILSLRSADYPGAESALKRAVSLDPKFSSAYLALGELCLARKDPKQADEYYKQGSSLAPLRSPSRLTYARYKMKYAGVNDTNSILEAISQVEEIVKQAPDYMPALLLLAQMDLGAKKYDDCAAVLQKILAREPYDYEGLTLDGQLAMAQPKPDPARAVASFSRLTQKYAQSQRRFAPPYYSLALSQVANKEPLLAIESLNRSIAMSYQSAYTQATNGVPANQPSTVTNRLNLLLITDPAFWDATMFLAELNGQRQNTAAAEASLTKVIQMLEQIVGAPDRLTEEQKKQFSDFLLAKTAQAHLFLARAYLKENNRERALAICERWERLVPTDPRPHYLSGLIQRGENHAADATQEFLDALKLSPDNPVVTEQLVQIDLAQKKFPAALSRIQTAIKNNPQASGLKLVLARVYQAQGSTNEAESTLRQVIKEKPDESAAYLMLANFAVEAGNQTKALEELDAAISHNPSNAEALLLKASIQEKQKNYAAAVSTYEKALSVNPQSGPALNNVAYLYATADPVKDMDKALDRGQRARQAMPTDPAVADTLGWILFNRRDYAQAQKLLQESTESFERAHSAQPDVFYHLGMANYMMLDEASARTAFQKALQFNTDFAGKTDAQKRLALLNLDPKSTAASSLAELQNRVKENPDDPVALLRLGALYEQNGSAPQARDAYEKLLNQNPKSTTILLRLAQLYAGPLRNPQRAMELTKTARALNTGDASVGYVLGKLTYQLGDPQLAVGLLKESAQRIADRPDLFYTLGLACYDIGQIGEAQIALTNALKLNPPAPQAEAARRFLSLAYLCNHPEQLPQSAAQVKQALAAEPELTPAMMASALLQEQRGDVAAAKQAYEGIRTKRPFFTPAVRQLALIYSQSPADAAKAYELATKAREAYPQDPLVAKALGIALYRRGDYSRALTPLRECSTRLVNDPEVFYFLGMSYSQSKPVPKKETTDALKAALTLNLKSPMSDDAKRVLQNIP